MPLYWPGARRLGMDGAPKASALRPMRLHSRSLEGLIEARMQPSRRGFREFGGSLWQVSWEARARFGFLRARKGSLGVDSIYVVYYEYVSESPRKEAA